MSLTQNVAVSVSQLNLFVKSLLDADLRLSDILVCGEISNFSGHYKSGHLYFTLKDEVSAIKAVMFSRNASSLRFRPENGMKVQVRGRVSVYERDGVYQIYVESMQPDGIGALTVAYEQLKNKLEKEGLFSPVHKKRIPAYPTRIGVVTSPTGAAVQDIINIINRRWPIAVIVLYPVSVQGDSAASEIRNAISELDKFGNCDVLIVGRGGGSIEDLWSFNDELLIRTIFHCKTPVVSAVGHETDFTLCDFVSDLRAPTPSAAAELATPDIAVEEQRLMNLNYSIHHLINNKIEFEREYLNGLLQTRSFSSPKQFFDPEKQTVDMLSYRLVNAYKHCIAKNTSRFGTLVSKLDVLSPLKVLSRGYAVVYKDSNIMNSVKDITLNENISIGMKDGYIDCTVDSITID
ncbi:MAG: exodeoxyribonuclease VII large subunit [Clostridia bacterium]|nr:exodeoxyribonuclease VII large subunit [Clostridia bacterium]